MKMKYSKKGDSGETSLLGGQRILKCDGRPETYGTLDEASAALGMARACCLRAKTRDIILSIQKDLAVLGAQLATLPEDADKFPYRIKSEHVDRLEKIIDELQDEVTIGKEFVYPGANVSSATIDLARTIIRRGERNAVRLMQEKVIVDEDILRFFNRLADLLFTLARYEEGCSEKQS